MAEALWMLACVPVGAGIALAGYWFGLMRGRAESLRLARCADAKFHATLLALAKCCTCGAAHAAPYPAFPPPPAPGFAARRKGGQGDA